MGNGNKWWRGLIALGVVVALPALALPKVSNSINDWLYGSSDKIVPPLPELKMQAEDSADDDFPAKGGSESIARLDYHDDENPASAPSKFRALSFQEDDTAANSRRGLPASAPPPLLPAESEENSPLSRPADSMARVREIRDQLATWGAEYMLLEALDQGKKFRFCCLMADERDQQVTFPFESTAPDAAVAAESVLSAVQQWRKQQIR